MPHSQNESSPTASILEDKVYAITGSASGIGFALALHLISLGARISIADNNKAALHHAVLEIDKHYPLTSDKVFPTVLDVRKPRDVEAWLARTIERFGRLDGAANLAGVVGNPPAATTVSEIDDEQWDFILGVNLTGVKNCMRAELKVMQSGASIVNAASVAAITASPQWGPYAVSKAGVVSLTRIAANEEGKRGIRVNAIAPGLVDTPMVGTLVASRGTENVGAIAATACLGRMGTPQEVAKLVTFLLSDDASFITGGIYVIDGGLSL